MTADLIPVKNDDLKKKGTNEKKLPTNETIIIAPHPDDELIGCWEVFESGVKPIVIYTSQMSAERQQDALQLKKHVDVKAQLFLRSIPGNLQDPSNTFYFPHPIYETHPEHRIQGITGEQLARTGRNVIFYITEMNAPFKYECKNPKKKKLLLDSVYFGESPLWTWDHKYFLFSGYDKWVYNV